MHIGGRDSALAFAGLARQLRVLGGTAALGAAAGKIAFFDCLAALVAPRGLDTAAAAQHAAWETLAAAWAPADGAPGGAAALVALVAGGARLPFAEVSLAAFGALEALALSPWGRRALCAHGGLVELVGDRHTHASPAHLAWKASIATVCSAWLGGPPTRPC